MPELERLREIERAARLLVSMLYEYRPEEWDDFAAEIDALAFLLNMRNDRATATGEAQPGQGAQQPTEEG